MKSEAQLKSMNATEQKAYAKEIGVDLKGNLGESEIIRRISEKQNAPDFIDPEADEFGNPKPEPELAGTEFMDTAYPHESGNVFTGGTVLEAAQRDSGLTVEDWNKQKPEKMREEIVEFVESTNFVQPVPYDPAETNKDAKKSVQEVMKDFPQVDYEIEENFITLKYNGRVESHNLQIPENNLRRYLGAMTVSE